VSSHGSEPPDLATRAAVLADLLAQGRIIHAGSMLATFVGLLALAGSALVADLASVVCVAWASSAALLGLIESYFAIRVGFDRALFRRVGHGLSLDTLDSSLAALDLIDEDGQGAAFTRRKRGCMRLLAWQAGVTVAQYILIIIGAICAVI